MLLLHLFDFPVIFLIIQLLLMATACLPIKLLNVYVNLESSRRRTDRILKMCPWTFAFLSVYFTPSSFSFFLSIFSLSFLSSFLFIFLSFFLLFFISFFFPFFFICVLLFFISHCYSLIIYTCICLSLRISYCVQSLFFFSQCD